jgi:xanthine dehydrogenase large subunit
MPAPPDVQSPDTGTLDPHANPSGELRSVRTPVRHDSAAKHVSGAALYVDDVGEPAGTLQIAIGASPAAKGPIVELDLDAVRTAPGVVAVVTAADIPGHNEISPVGTSDDPLLAEGEVLFHGQPIFIVVAKTRAAARHATLLAKVRIGDAEPLLTVEAAEAADSLISPDFNIVRGDPGTALAKAANQMSGNFPIGGQEHFYLEGQAALAIPQEDGDMFVLTSTQHPSEVQKVVAEVLGQPINSVVSEVRRMGGGFGGKESQACQWAGLAALAARVTGRPCKLRLDRDDDMVMTGKRHDMLARWQVGFDDHGMLEAADITFLAKCGFSTDLSNSVVDRTAFHTDNAYFVPHIAARTKRLRTNTVSNTAFRGFGGPQGMLAIEHVMDQVAHRLGIDAFDLRMRNLYGPGRDVTPYGMTVFDNIAPEVMEKTETLSGYRARRRAIAEHNAKKPFLRKGLAITPVKFGISFTATHLNQAGALVHVYTDGSVHLNHGGTEMGQGLFTKVAQVVADEFGIDLDKVKITATTTAKVPNTSPTAASSGTDLNAMAARIATAQIRERLTDFAAEAYDGATADVRFRDNQVFVGNRAVAFADLVKQAYMARISLSSTGFYRTPKIHWDREKGQGRPFFYFAYGASCSEVTIDTLTGELRVDRVDIVHDVGKSLNPAIDIGQIEGGFVQGMGWLTTEELVWDAGGRLRTHAPSTYKIPTSSDVPAEFNVHLHDGVNREEAIYGSKAVGEPPLMLAISVHSAIFDAIAGLAPQEVAIPLDAPATPEAILRAVTAVREARP